MKVATVRNSLTIGTRGSPLALAQTHECAGKIAAAHGWPAEAITIRIIKTSGDMIVDRALSEAGGKGLFTKELDEAMLRGEIDLAVHSAKDLPTVLPGGLSVGGYLEREDPRDAFLSSRAKTLQALPQGAVLGTASLRRRALALRIRPDLNIVLLRGNVETRLRKVESGEIDATLLALAGLKRLGLAGHATSILETDAFLPAVGQGAVAITLRDTDAATRAALAPVLHKATGEAVSAERAFLRVLDGSCRTPIAGLALVAAGHLRFRGMVLSVDGAQVFSTACNGHSAAGEALGMSAGQDILARMPRDFLKH